MLVLLVVRGGGHLYNRLNTISNDSVRNKLYIYIARPSFLLTHTSNLRFALRPAAPASDTGLSEHIAEQLTALQVVYLTSALVTP